MKTKLLFASLMALALVMTRVSADEEPEFSATCPVSGGPAKEAHCIEFEGAHLYFCCDNCPKAFEADPAKYAAPAHHQMAHTGEIVQVACPFSGQPCNPEATLDVNGVTVAFCCNNCLGKAKKSDDVVALVFTDISMGFTTQTTCPVSGEAINPEQFCEYEGRRVYFCCENCKAKFEASPDEFKDKLPPAPTAEE